MLSTVLKGRIFSALAALTALVTTTLVSASAMAEEAGSDVAHNPNAGYIAIAIAIGIGIAALGGAFGQSRAAAAALEGIARNPNASDKVFVPMILGMAFIESLVLFTWVLMFLLLNKI